tara:strand:+ start:12518 stop:12700 length:183 start_codon:yes stop_codon:yes gene_type:complete
MNPDEIKLESLAKNFEYEKLSREIDGCDSISELKNIAKCYAKIHLRYQETISTLRFDKNI